MYIEGKCLADQLIKPLVKHIDEATDENDNKMWQMISSNTGENSTSTNVDGWVFKSAGSSGEDNILIGFKNVLFHAGNPNNWPGGHTVFTAAQYTPGNPGTNGSFENLFREPLPIMYSSIGQFNDTTTPIKYHISINKDRVIFGYYVNLTSHSYNRSNLVLIGKPGWTADPADRGTAIMSALSTSAASRLNMTRPNRHSTADAESLTVYADVLTTPRGWGGKVFPSHLSIAQSTNGKGGHRAVLDVLVMRQDGSFRKVDTVKIGDTEYLTMELPDTASIAGATPMTLYNTFMPTGQGGGTFIYLFPKI